MLKFAIFFAGGGAYFAGLLFILLSPLITNIQHALVRALRDRIIGLGLVLVFLSSTPAPRWYYGLLVGALGGWIALRSRLGRGLDARWSHRARAIVVLACLLGIALELPRRFLSVLPAERADRLYVFGDAWTAESAQLGNSWPQVLARAQDRIEVNDHCYAGAMLEDTLDSIDDLAPGPCVVILSVGLNDVWGETTAAAFEAQLRALLDKARGPRRRLVMFELPLPLLGQPHGWIQRRLARRYGVTLIPRRILSAHLVESDSRPGDLFLSDEAHARLAGQMWKVIGPAFR